MSIILKNDQLEIAMYKPGEGYTGSRFDWTGFITQVTYEGHTFCTAEQILPERKTTYGEGLCGEFCISAADYAELKKDDWFPKVGIGKMQKPNDESSYRVHFNYVKTTGEFKWSQDNDGVSFHALPVRVNGYAADMKKTLRLEGAVLIIDYTLANVGEKEIRVDEYAHNFMAVDGLPLSGDYNIKVPFRYNEGMVDHPDVIIKDDGFTFARTPASTVAFSYMKSFKAVKSWELTHAKQRVGMREIDPFEVAFSRVWCQEHVAALSFYITIAVKPGQTKQWSRRFECFTF